MKVDPKAFVEISNLLKEYQVELVIMHGSQAEGKTHARSDLDVAICVRTSTTLDSFEDWSKLQSAFVGILGQGVDLGVIRTDSDPLYAYEALRKGKLLWQVHPAAYAWWFSLIIRRYDDTAWLRRLEKQAVQKRFGGNHVP